VSANTSPEPEKGEIVFPPGEAPKTAENFLKKRFPIGYVRKLFRKKAVRVNGRRCRPGDLLGPGDRIRTFIPFAEPGPSTPPAEPHPPLRILEENAHFLIVDKPAGLPVHEGKRVRKHHSLLGRLEAALRPRGIAPRLVHRLDRETSGLMVVAKTAESAAELEARFSAGEVEKEYLALVAGELPAAEGRIDLPLPGRGGGSVPALTLYRVERRFAGATLVRVRLRTGRMHQIRLHFAKIGHPVVMDDRYGDFAFNKGFRKAYGLKRQFLHASALAFSFRGRRSRWSAPLPDDLREALRALERSCARASPAR
jgi:23S rRNA pseudouridine955/2504/2580 synthase